MRGLLYFQEKYDHKVTGYRNNEELYEKAKPDAVIISTADFQHALHAMQAVEAGCDVYVEKPFAETMADNRAALKTIQASDKNCPDWVAAAQRKQLSRRPPLPANGRLRRYRLCRNELERKPARPLAATPVVGRNPGERCGLETLSDESSAGGDRPRAE